MDDLTAFIAARLDEDEAIAKTACEEYRPTWTAVWTASTVYARIVDGDGLPLAGTDLRGVAEHIVHHDPARVLREIAAKRAIIAEYERAVNGSLEWGVTSALEDTVSHLADIWSDHDDYRPEWAPRDHG